MTLSRRKTLALIGKAFAIWMHWESFFSLPSFERAGSIQ